MIAASIIGGRALQPIETVASSWKTIIAARQAWQRLDELLSRAPKREEGMPLPQPRGIVSASGVGCAIGGRQILRNVNFELAAGEALGVIGPSGSGKSCLVRLLVGAWPCTTGVVRLDGCNIYNWPREDAGRHIGYLPQDVELFAGTVRDNIARMGPDDPQAIALAAQRAGAHEMILSLPQGYDTEIGPQGQKLSGGQAQRIGIARALFRHPKLIVLDEPNSNLDGPGENALAAVLSQLKAEGITIIVVAHRASILRGVDKILALQNGTVEAFGPRDTVLQHFIQRSRPVPGEAESKTVET
jgi:PrtD family type I secretion system ABC transporter